MMKSLIEPFDDDPRSFTDYLFIAAFIIALDLKLGKLMFISIVPIINQVILRHNMGWRFNSEFP